MSESEKTAEKILDYVAQFGRIKEFGYKKHRQYISELIELGTETPAANHEPASRGTKDAVNSELNHTPAPWFANTYRAIIQTDDPGLRSTINNKVICYLATTNQSMPITTNADARLIAAAPDLLRELRHLVRLIEPCLETGLSIAGLATLNGAKLAIIKAMASSVATSQFQTTRKSENAEGVSQPKS